MRQRVTHLQSTNPHARQKDIFRINHPSENQKKLGGAAEARRAHNPEVPRSKRGQARLSSFFCHTLLSPNHMSWVKKYAILYLYIALHCIALPPCCLSEK
ncbi:hypothetical protein B0T18DRAFT_159096 [Schizothecium vesticola]|uniref:Uncharacterized protein n=1 Tax=Schizothecium vesticola TaxID=314040 RepID=A0AA40K5L2_9PEZI|nr:hypothetical protein B0T18DRAFT_159096 [Schizothecium vesticola]